ncbi:MAG: adenosine kinase [Planctomycetota bacterium]|nr:adenosine kinase [Planctomycetota bacterium]MCX8039144.1 adenosine kinase [Planctomycetota bacterium]MDW8372564.1 adenosine kinase [Planctomycetota bacterium]
MSAQVVGFGSPLVDLCLSVDEAFLAAEVGGERGGMQLVSAETIERVLAAHGGQPAQAPGGSACNVVCGLAALGIAAAFIGCIGDDAYGQHLATALAMQGVEARLIVRRGLPTGRVLALVTPDGQRTFRTCLGAAASLSAAEVQGAELRGARFVVMEGYSTYDPQLARAIAAAARAAGAELVLDFAAHEVVRAARPLLEELLAAGLVAIAVLNEDEAAAWSGGEPLAALDMLAPQVRLCAVKRGAQGAVLAEGRQRLAIPAVPAEVVDTIGAGDAWLAGLLAGLVRGLPLAVCGELAAHAGAAAVAVAGAQVPRARWRQLAGRLDAWT